MLASSSATWYAARAGGLVAFAALTASVVLGLTLSGKARLAHWPRFAVEDVHRFAGVLAGTFIALHGAALLVDNYLPFSLGNLLVPGTAPYRPLWTALGVVAAELLFALAITNRFRKRLPYKTWRRAHYANFAVWVLAFVHGLGAGTDTGTVWAVSLYASAAAAVTGLTLWRGLRAAGFAPWVVRLWPGAAGVLAAELVIALVGTGSLHSGR
jgi:sulfoxide reductase heme-binding subunit YedZ